MRTHVLFDYIFKVACMSSFEPVFIEFVCKFRQFTLFHVIRFECE